MTLIFNCFALVFLIVGLFYATVYAVQLCKIRRAALYTSMISRPIKKKYEPFLSLTCGSHLPVLMSLLIIGLPT